MTVLQWWSISRLKVYVRTYNKTKTLDFHLAEQGPVRLQEGELSLRKLK